MKSVKALSIAASIKQFEMKLLLSFIFVLIISQCTFQNLNHLTLTTIEIIQNYGYPLEVHTVMTKDGYLLQMHRIPYGIKNNTQLGAEKRRKFPILFSNGLFGSSADVVSQGPERSLAFLLANMGFDVWLGNFRGNIYSRAHAYLSPESKQFWDFSFHESGIYDLPAQIDYVCSATKSQKVIHIGHSMGTTTFFIMTSTLPQYNDKIEVSLLMAPVAYVKNVRSPLLRVSAHFAKVTKFFDELIDHGELYPQSKFITILSRILCQWTKIEKRLCESVIFLFSGTDPKEYDENLLTSYLKVYPNSYSVKGAYHFSQLFKSGEFRPYDYDFGGNMIRYNSLTPPNYNLSAITAKMYFYVGSNDYISTLVDVMRLALQLPTLKKFRIVGNPMFNHLDFFIALHAKEILYDFMISDLESHLNGLE